MTQPLETSAQALEDRYQRRVDYLRVSVTDRCNFRCRYCMPEEGDPFAAQAELLTVDEIVRLVEVFAARGVKKVRITGGEPLVRRDVPELVARLKAVPGIAQVALTTNAFLLARQAEQLKAAGLDSVNISLDSLDRERFERLARVDGLARVLAGIDAAKAAGIASIKLNAVIIRGFNDDEILELVRFAIERGVLMRFIEFMPIGQDTLWSEQGLNTCVPAAELRQVLRARYALEPEQARYGAGPARYWRLSGPGISEGSHVSVGIISAVTECFCADCNRMRLTSQGGLRGCLADDHEIDLREIIRSDLPQPHMERALALAIGRALGDKKERHSFDLSRPGVTFKAMNAIGG